jgi:4-amino-4-deoxy-L-arabinose transferase-like glycosyltransferase
MAVTARYEDPTRSARHLGLLLDFAARSHARAVALLVPAALLNFLPGVFEIPPIDRDEARFAQATKQMIESGEYVDIRFQEEARYKKPVGIYWLQAGVVKTVALLGMSRPRITIWLYRIPSLAGALGGVLLTYWAALAFAPRRTALIAALMMASSLLLGVKARLATTDAMLLATVVAAMGALARLCLPEQREHLDTQPPWLVPAIFWTALAAGVLIKGPAIIMMAALAAAALSIIDRKAGWLLALSPLAGLLWFAALMLPWFIAIIGRADNAFLAESVGHGLLAKLYSNQEGHGAPPGTYIVLFWLIFFPGATLAGLAVPAILAVRREPGAKFLLAWLVPSWLVLELVVTKLPHYVLRLYPAIAILIAGILEARMLSRNRWLGTGTSWWVMVPALVGIAGIVAMLSMAHPLGLFAWALAGAASVAGLAAWRLYEVDGAERSLLRGMAAVPLICIALFGVVIPSLEPLFPSSALARILSESGCANPIAAAAGYQEPSLVFLASTPTRFTSAAGAADFLAAGDCHVAFIEARQERAFAERAEAIGLRYAPGPRIDGFNMSNLQMITIAVFRLESPS